MKKTRVAISLLLVAIIVAVLYYYSLGGNIYRRATQHALDTFSEAVAIKQTAKLGSAFKYYLANNAKIHLEVGFVSLQNPQGNTSEAQDFDKPTFYMFIDNILYSLQDYHVDFHLQNFKLDAEKKSASLTFTSKAWGDSELSYGDVHTNTHFTADSTCEGYVLFDENTNPTFDTLNCKVRLTSLPKLAGSR